MKICLRVEGSNLWKGWEDVRLPLQSTTQKVVIPMVFGVSN